MGVIGKSVVANVRLLATTDVHMQISARDTVPPGGLALLSHTIRAARDTASGHVILVDNGDALQGTPLARAGHEGPHTAEHPLVATMMELGYDAMGLGNHDFDFGSAYLDAICAAMPWPVLSANTHGLQNTLQSVLLPLDLRCSDAQTRMLNLGITSALPHQTGQWISHALEPQVHFSPALEQLGSVVQDLKHRGADVILLLAHSGIEIGPGDKENFACAAATVPNVDVMVMGHSHRMFPNADEAPNEQVDPKEGRINGIPCVQPGFGGNCLGQIDLELSYDGNWQLLHAEPSLLFPESSSPDPKILACIAPARARLAAEAHEIIGQAPKPMHSYFAMLQPNPALGLVAESMIDGLAELDLQDAFAKLPRLAAIAPTLCGGLSGPEHYLDISAGPVPASALDVLCPYEDRLTAKVMRGMDLREHLERAAAIYLAPEAFCEDVNILHPDMPGFCFDSILGLGVSIDLSRPPRYDPAGTLVDSNAFRITRMAYDGLPVGDDDLFLLALTSYRAGGGAGYPDRGQVLTQDRPRPMLRDLVRKRLGKEDPVLSPDWDLKGNPGQRISYMTSAHARAHLHELSHFDPADLGITQEGFMHLRLTL